MKKHLRSWGAIYILLALFLGSWTGQLISQSIEFTKEARSHGEAFAWADFWPSFWAATFENWESEFLQLAVQAVLLATALQWKLFTSDVTADKKDVDKIIQAVREHGKWADRDPDQTA